MKHKRWVTATGAIILIAGALFFGNIMFADYRATKDMLETSDLLNRQGQSAVKTIYQDTLSGSADTTGNWNIGKLSGNTGFVRMKIRTDTLGTPSTGFSYQWEVYFDASDTLSDGSFAWGQNLDGTSIEIGTGDAINADCTWIDILDVPTNGYIRYRLAGGTDADNAIILKMIQWVW